MRVKTIVPEANEWVQTVAAINGTGATAKHWEGQQLRPATPIELEIGTLGLIVNSISAGLTRREWQRLAIVDKEGHWMEVDHSSKTNREYLASVARNLLSLDPDERLREALKGQYERAQSREYHLSNWIQRLQSAIQKYPQQFLDALDSRDPTLKLPTALPGERFVFYVERGAQERGMTMLKEALTRTTAELEIARSTIRRYEETHAIKE